MVPWRPEPVRFRAVTLWCLVLQETPIQPQTEVLMYQFVSKMALEGEVMVFLKAIRESWSVVKFKSDWDEVNERFAVDIKRTPRAKLKKQVSIAMMGMGSSSINRSESHIYIYIWSVGVSCVRSLK